MHLFVFENGEQRFGAGQQRVRRIVERRVRDVVDERGIAGVAELAHGRAIGPIVAPVACREVERPRIDAALEEQLESRVDRRAVECAFVQHEVRERGEMTLVEHERMAERNRGIVICRRRDRGEEGGASRATAPVAVDERGAVE